MSDYTSAALRERAQSYAEMALHARAAETKHRTAATNAASPLARYAASALVQTSNCTAMHWKKIATALDLAAEELEEQESKMDAAPEEA